MSKGKSKDGLSKKYPFLEISAEAIDEIEQAINELDFSEFPEVYPIEVGSRRKIMWQ